MVYLPYYTRPSLMKYSIIFIFLLFISQYTFAQETKARDMAIDSTLILVDSVITLPKKQEVIILKQPKYLSPKPTEQSFEVLDKSPASPQITKRFTKHLKNKPFKKNTDLTNGEKLAIVGGIFLGIGLCLLGVRNINSTKTLNFSLIVGIPSIIIGFLAYKDFNSMKNFILIGWFFEFLSVLYLIVMISGIFTTLLGILGHLKLIFLWVSGGLITFGLIFMGVGILFFVWAYFIDR